MTFEISKYEWIICETEQNYFTNSDQYESNTSIPLHPQSGLSFPYTSPSKSENSLENSHLLPTSTESSSTRSRFQDINPFEPSNLISETNSAETIVEEPLNTSEQQYSGHESIATTRQSQESAPEPSLEDLHWSIALRNRKRS